jgi:hypothetical protein
VLLILAGSAMIAHGLRMMTQGLLYPNSIYPAPVPTSIDFWFDWFTLAVLGFIILYIGGKQWMQWVKKKRLKKDTQKKTFPMPT